MEYEGELQDKIKEIDDAELKILFEAFIQLIATAIDKKSDQLIGM